MAGAQAPDHDVEAHRPLIVDIDATPVTAHSDQERAAPTFKRGFGFTRRGPSSITALTGPVSSRPVCCVLENARSNTAADHIGVVCAALAQLPGRCGGARPGCEVLVRADGARCTHEFLNWQVSQRLSYLVGFSLPDMFAATLAKMPKHGWTPAYDGDGQVGGGAWVADVIGPLDLTLWPAGMRVIARKERLNPVTQLRITDATDTASSHSPPTRTRARLADLEPRHRRRAYCRTASASRRTPAWPTCRYTTFAQNQIW